jgi:PAS domain S-box-containing protein
LLGGCRNLEPITSFKVPYEYILENIRDIIFTLSPDGRITSMTREFENATGWPLDEWHGKHFLEIVHPDDAAVVIKGFESVISGELPAPYEARVRSKSGEYLIFEAKSTPHIIDGEIVGYLGVARDITKRKEAENVLLASEKQYEDIINSLGDAIHVIDKNYQIVLSNPAFTNWMTELGINTQIQGKTVIDAFPFLSEKIYEEYDQVFNSNEPLLTIEENEINEKVIFTETRKIPIIHHDEVIQILTIIRDITERMDFERQLRESEERLRGFMDGATDYFSLWDSDLNMVDLNQAALCLFSKRSPKPLKKEDIIGINMLEFANTPSDLDHYYEVLKTNEPYNSDEIAPHRIFGDLLLSAKAFKVGDGLGLITTDITQRKKMEEELKASEERLRGFMDGTTDSFSLWDSNLNMIDFNQATLQMFSERSPKPLKKEDIIGKNMLEFSTFPSNLDKYHKVMKTNKPYISDRIALHKLFEDLQISVKAFKVGDGLGLITTDITERKKMEEELKASEEKFRSIFENAPIGLALADLNFGFNKINAVFCQMLGYSEKELTQMSFIEITHPEHREKEMNFIKRLKKGVISSYKTEKRFLRKRSIVNDKEVLWARTTIFIQRDEKGGPSYFLLVCEDISVMKEKEEQLRRQMLKYNTEEGFLYLVKEDHPILAKTVFNDLVKFGYRGIIASRERNDAINNNITDESISFHHFSEDNTINDLLDIIKETKEIKVILIDRMEYLFNTEGFNKTIKFVYTLNDFAFLQKLIVILSVDSSALTDREMQIIEKETKDIELRFITKLAEELMDVIHVIYQQNTLGIKPSYSDVGQLIQISRPTTRKRIKNLMTTGYISEFTLGKRKLLEVTTKGISLLDS